MKRLILTIMMIVLLQVNGCTGAFTDDIANLAVNVKTLSTQVDTYQAEMQDIIDNLEADGVIDEATSERIENINKKIDALQPQVETMATAIANTNLTGDTFSDAISLAQAGNEASKGWNPYAAPIGIGLTFAAAIAEWFRRQEKTRREKEETKRRAEKAGVQKTIVKLSTMNESDINVNAVNSMLYENIGEARGRSGTS